MARMLNPVHLVLGEDDFLAERATKAIVAQAGEGVEVTTLRAGDVSEGEIAMATSPSLFAEDRVVVELSPYDLDRGRITYRYK